MILLVRAFFAFHLACTGYVLGKLTGNSIGTFVAKNFFIEKMKWATGIIRLGEQVKIFSNQTAIIGTLFGASIIFLL